MGKSVQLTAADGHVFNVYCSEPTGKPKGAVVIVQEIFGVTAHIRGVTDQYAAAGYLALAPAFFDRLRPGIELTPQQFDEARSNAGQLHDLDTYADLAATVQYASRAGKVAVIGYCWGGTVAHVAACRLPIAAAISYYGTRTLQYLGETVHAPVLYHFGELDSFLSSDAIAQIQAANPHGEFHVYTGAQHAFNNNLRPDKYHPQAAELALKRSLGFLSRHVD
ncbi:MAG: dienelactone hydrolase family protein [Steroidobacteraceae bacterium]